MKNPSATPKPVPSTPPRTKIAIPRQSLFMVSLLSAGFACCLAAAGRARVRSRLGCKEDGLRWRQAQPKREQRGGAERERDPADAGRPSDAIEDLAEDRRPDEAAGEVTGEIDAAGGAAISGGGAADEAGRRCLRKECPDADEDHAQQDRCQIGQQKQPQADRRP